MGSLYTKTIKKHKYVMYVYFKKGYKIQKYVGTLRKYPKKDWQKIKEKLKAKYGG